MLTSTDTVKLNRFLKAYLSGTPDDELRNTFGLHGTWASNLVSSLRTLGISLPRRKPFFSEDAKAARNAALSAAGKRRAAELAEFRAWKSRREHKAAAAAQPKRPARRPRKNANGVGAL